MESGGGGGGLVVRRGPHHSCPRPPLGGSPTGNRTARSPAHTWFPRNASSETRCPSKAGQWDRETDTYARINDDAPKHMMQHLAFQLPFVFMGIANNVSSDYH